MPQLLPNQPCFLLFLLVLSLSACRPEPQNPYPPEGFERAAYAERFVRLYGGSAADEDELASGLVTDQVGNAYFYLNIQLSDGQRAVLIAKTSPLGELLWTKTWDNGVEAWAPDPLPGRERGGAPSSISIDQAGDLYLALSAADAWQPQNKSLVVLKINGQDGSLIWQQQWRPLWPDSGQALQPTMRAEAYALDASVGDYVYVTGRTGQADRFAIPVLALHKNDGSLYFQYSLGGQVEAQAEAYALRADAQGRLYLGGRLAGNSAVFRLNGANSSSPSLAWIQQFTGANTYIGDLDLDAGELYLAVAGNGEATAEVLKMSAEGRVIWGKRYFPFGEGPSVAHTIRALGNHVYVGGVLSLEELDAESGDAMLFKLNKRSGELLWSGLYYTGWEGRERVEHRVKGLGLVDGDIVVLAQAYTGPNNRDVFSGEWLRKDNLVLDDRVPSMTSSALTNLSPIDLGAVRSVQGNYRDSPSSLQWLRPQAKTTNNPPDADAFLSRLRLN